MRSYETLPNRVRILKEVLCDRCGDSCIQTDGNVEAAHLTAKFEHGFHQGDRFLFDLCQGCFDDIAGTILVIDEGRCIYENAYHPDMTFEHLLAMYAAMIRNQCDGDDCDDE